MCILLRLKNFVFLFIFHLFYSSHRCPVPFFYHSWYLGCCSSKGFPLSLAQFPFSLVVDDSFRRLHFTVGYLGRKAYAFASFLTHVDVHRQLGIYGLWHLPRLHVWELQMKNSLWGGCECLARVHCIFCSDKDVHNSSGPLTQSLIEHAPVG